MGRCLQNLLGKVGLVPEYLVLSLTNNFLEGPGTLGYLGPHKMKGIHTNLKVGEIQ